MTIRKPRHWNLGTGIGIRNGTGIGTDIKRYYFQFYLTYGP